MNGGFVGRFCGTVICLLLLSCTSVETGPAAKELYSQSVENAKAHADAPAGWVAAPDDMLRVSGADSVGANAHGLKFYGDPADNQLIVRSLSSSKAYNGAWGTYAKAGDNYVVYGSKTSLSSWVTTGNEMTKFIDSQNLTSASIVKRLERGLGMNDTGTHDAIFEMAVVVGNTVNQYLLRPTRNPDPTVYGSDPAMYGTKAPFPADASAAGIGTGAAADAVYASYKAAYVNWAGQAYTTTPFPWTQLGYTYHWGQVDNVPVNLADVQGMSEFIMLGGTGGADSAKTPSGTDESGKLVTIGIYSPQSYIYTKNDGTSLSSAVDAQYGNGIASFNVTGACDTLWAGTSFQAGAHLDAASPNTIMIGAGGTFSGGQGVLVGSLNYTVSNVGSLAVNADMKKFNLAGSENIVLLFKGDSHDVPWQGNVKNILINSGAITAPTTNGTAVAAWAGDTEIINTGTITGTGSGYAIMTSSGNDLISNSGTVTGGIHTLGGNDTVAVTGGSVSGEIDLGSDNADAFSASNTVFHVTIQHASGTVAPIRGMQIAKIADQGGIVIAVKVSETDIIKDKEIFPVVVVNPGGTLHADISRITVLNDPALPMIRFSPQQAGGALLLAAAYDGADAPDGDMAAVIGTLDRLGNPADTRWDEPVDAGIVQAEGTAGFVVGKNNPL